jgi:hypothetical protein
MFHFSHIRRAALVTCVLDAFRVLLPPQPEYRVIRCRVHSTPPPCARNSRNLL